MRRAPLLALLFPLALTVIGPATVAATGHLVRITSRLEPAQLTIAPGDTVTFRNDDDRRHRLRSRTEAGEFDTNDLQPGASYRVRFSASGTFAYIDERDDDDQRYWGTIVVAEGTAPDPTDGASGGGGGGGGGGSGGGGSTAPTAATIRLADRVFSPGSVTIAAGGTVTWRNDDDREHTATATGTAFDSGELAPGETYRKTFENAGAFPFLCVIHPEMQGTVTVTSGAAGGATPRPATTPRPTPQPTSRAESGDPAHVAIVDLDFEPREVEVPAGSSVTWTNTGVAPHTATADGGAFDSDQIDPGGSFTATFAEPGRFAYLCAIHPSMTGVVTVRASTGAGAGLTPGPTASPPPSLLTTAAPTSAGPSPGGIDSTAPPGAAARSEGGTGESAGSTSGTFAASLVSTILAIALIVGALMVGTGLVMGTARRGGASGRAG